MTTKLNVPEIYITGGEGNYAKLIAGITTMQQEAKRPVYSRNWDYKELVFNLEVEKERDDYLKVLEFLRALKKVDKEGNYIIGDCKLRLENKQAISFHQGIGYLPRAAMRMRCWFTHGEKFEFKKKGWLEKLWKITIN